MMMMMMILFIDSVNSCNIIYLPQHVLGKAWKKPETLSDWIWVAAKIKTRFQFLNKNVFKETLVMSIF